MAEQNPPVSGVETRLESMERRLAEIQQELAPEGLQAPGPPDATAAAADSSPEPDPRLAPPPADPPPAAPEDPPPAPPSDPGPREPAEPTPAAAPPGATDLELLGSMYADLLATTRKLLDGYEAAMARISSLPASPPASAGDEATVSVGPFRSTEALREFERVLAELPGVREVELRGYESGDRAILEVRLEEETS